MRHYINKDSSFHLSSNISQSAAVYSQLQFLLSSLATMCVALISLFTCNSFRDLHQLRTTYGGPDLQSFYFVPWKPTRNNFLFEYWVFTEVLLFTRDSGLWNHILQEFYPKNLTATFINSSLFKCSLGSYRAIKHSFFSLRVCCLLLFTAFKKLLVQLQPVSVVSSCTPSCAHSTAAETEMRGGTWVSSRPTHALKLSTALIPHFLELNYTWQAVKKLHEGYSHHRYH